jgi:hypothetical protein
LHPLDHTVCVVDHFRLSVMCTPRNFPPSPLRSR